MRHEHFLRSLCEQAQGNRKNSVMGLLKEGPQDHPNNRLSGYFNKPKQPRTVGDLEPLTPDRERLEIESYLRFVIQKLTKLLNYVPSITDERQLKKIFNVVGSVHEIIANKLGE